jgi:hypothetical protein
MKKLMIAALSLSLLSGTAVFAAQNSGQTNDSTTMSKKKTKHKKGKHSTTDTTSTTSNPK